MKVVTILLFFCSLVLSDTLSKSYFSSKTDTYKQISHSEFTMALKLFEKLLQDEVLDSEQRYQLKQLHLEFKKVSERSFILTDVQHQGRGFYIINYAYKNMLSIPHRFHDLRTGNIALKLMRERPYRATAFNTVSRKIVDYAHTNYTLFQAFHLTYAKLYPREYIYQLHGFKEKKFTGIQKSIIVSSTTTQASSRAKSINSCLNAIGYKSKLYGESIFELGGTTNIQANILRENGYWNFLHIELESKVREILYRDRDARDKFVECIQ